MSESLSRRRAGLDWLNFFVANLQTAFGPFIAIFLTGQHWTQGQIGWALSVGSITAMASQVPAGIVVDALPNKRRAASWAIFAIIAASLMLALMPAQLPVALAEVLHGFASCMLSPAIAAVSLGVVALTAAAHTQTGVATDGVDPQDALVALTGARFGRNASFASVGSAVAAALMAAVGYTVSARATLFLGALLALPGLYALRVIGNVPPPPTPVRQAATAQDGQSRWRWILHLLTDRVLLVFLVCVVFYHLGNAAMLSLAASEITRQAGNTAELVIGACILIPQILVALLSPLIGRYAGLVGMRTVVMIGFAALPLRGVLLSLTTAPFATVAIELLDGVSSATFGVMMPLIAADIARRNGHFNLCLGILGLGMGLGATLSTTLAGSIADTSLSQAFLFLAASGAIATVLGFALPGRRASKSVAPASARPEMSAEPRR